MNTFDFLGNPLVGVRFKSETQLDYSANKSIYEMLLNQEAKLAVVGLGYVGLPIALEFAKDFDVIGYDINDDRIEQMKRGVDPSKELGNEDFRDRNIHFTSTSDCLIDADVYVVAVPTPVGKNKTPNLFPLLSACEVIGKTLGRGDIVIFESTVYPGCTEEDCIPVLEEVSGLKVNIDFKVGYSPERINPGDKKNTLTSITKIVAGSDEEGREEIYNIYNHIIDAGIHIAPSIKVAEAAKIVENTQRDINIAFMNELSLVFDKMNINTHDVLAAAGTKWNFLNFYPGLVGGHCIGVDPYYLIHKAKDYGVDLPVISNCRLLNDAMPEQVVQRVEKALSEMGKELSESKVLVLGATFKENVSDLRNSKAAELALLLRNRSRKTEVLDPLADSAEMEQYYEFSLIDKMSQNYDVVIYAVNHDQFASINWGYIRPICNDQAVVFDFKRTLGKPSSIFGQIEYLTL